MDFSLITDNLATIITASVLALTWYANWRRDKYNEKVSAHEQLSKDYERKVKECESTEAKLREQEKLFAAKLEELRSRLAERDEVVANLAKRIT